MSGSATQLIEPMAAVIPDVNDYRRGVVASALAGRERLQDHASETGRADLLPVVRRVQLGQIGRRLMVRLVPPASALMHALGNCETLSRSGEAEESSAGDSDYHHHDAESRPSTHLLRMPDG